MSMGNATRTGLLPSTRLAIQAGVSALAALVFVNFVNIDRPYWVIMTAVVVMVGTSGETLAKSMDRTLGTLFGLIAGLAIYWVTVLIHVPAVVLLVIAVPSIVVLKFASYRLMVAAVTATVVLLLELGGASQSLILSRLVDTAIGAAIAVATSFLILRLPTRRPILETVDAYDTALAAMVHDSLQAVIEGRWSADIGTRVGQLRASAANFEPLADALRAESALIGGGDIARAALAVLPVLRGHADSIISAAQAAARTGLGAEITEELQQVDRQICANLDAVRTALETGTPQAVPRLDSDYQAIQQRLLPKLGEGARSRHDVVAILNLLLALRRLNHGLRNVMANLGKSD